MDIFSKLCFVLLNIVTLPPNKKFHVENNSRRYESQKREEFQAQTGLVSTIQDDDNMVEVENSTTLTEKLKTPNGTVLGPISVAQTPESFALELANSLKSNDQELLEACLSNRDEDFIQVAVKRLKTSLAVTLFEQIFERVNSSPARATTLAVWIKWTMITHGGYLVSLQETAESVASLHNTLQGRLANAPKLLALQGRVQMLRAQMQLRRESMENSTNGPSIDEESDAPSEADEANDAGLIVNGEEDFDDDEDEEEEVTGANQFIDMEAEESDMNSEEELELVDDMEIDEIEEPSVKPLMKTSKKKDSKKPKANGKSRR